MIKELEALKNVVNEISNYKLHGIGTENWLGIQDVLKDIDTIEEALTKLDKLERLLTLMSYHCVVELKETSIEKSKIYEEYKREIQEYKKLFYEFKER
jgi:hypothetical protein